MIKEIKYFNTIINMLCLFHSMQNIFFSNFKLINVIFNSQGIEHLTFYLPVIYGRFPYN